MLADRVVASILGRPGGGFISRERALDPEHFRVPRQPRAPDQEPTKPPGGCATGLTVEIERQQLKGRAVAGLPFCRFDLRRHTRRVGRLTDCLRPHSKIQAWHNAVVNNLLEGRASSLGCPGAQISPQLLHGVVRWQYDMPPLKRSAG